MGRSRPGGRNAEREFLAIIVEQVGLASRHRLRRLHRALRQMYRKFEYSKQYPD